MRTLLSTMAGLSIAALLAGCGQKPAETASTEEITPPAVGDSQTAAPAAGESEGEKAEDAAKVLASLPAPFNAADLENGRKKFALCRSCHSIEEGGPNLTGPHLYGVFGRQSASVEGYNYSEAMKKANFTWTPEKLQEYLPDPKVLVPGTKMAPVLALKSEKDETDLIAYLMVETGYKPQ